ncbi:MAG: branched-chain amino acid ABC transporter permease [bacterium]|nr:MAG: branched-chain amino acid ABC transporter permease [bacterium]
MKMERTATAAAIILLAVFPVIAASSDNTSYYIDIMTMVGIYSMITVGLTLLVGYAGQISLGHAAFFGIGAYSSGVLTTKFGINPWAALAAGAAISSTIAYLIGLPSLKLKGHYLAMATLAFGIIIYIFFKEAGYLTGGPSGLTDIPGISIFGFSFDSDLKYYFLVYTVLLLEIIYSRNIMKSRVGRALKAIRDDEDAASATGVAVYQYKLKIFVLSALFASIAGSLYAYYFNFIDPSSFGFFPSVKFLIMIIVGGLGSLPGTLFGTWFITFLDSEWLSSVGDLTTLVYGIILLLLLMFLPNGVAGECRNLKIKIIKWSNKNK